MTAGALYQELILDHNRKPKNFRVWRMPIGRCLATTRCAAISSRCGSRWTVTRIADVSFKGQGCAISKASASMMTTAVKGKTREEAEALFDKFHDLVTGKLDEAQAKELGSLRAFGGVSKFPLRVKCASLAWHTLKSALEGEGTIVSTEDEGPADMLEGA